MSFSINLGKLHFELGTRVAEPVTKKSASFSPQLMDWMRGEGIDAVLTHPYEQSVWVYTVVSALAQAVSAIPFRISRGDRSGENLVKQGPVVDLFNRPHEYMNRFRFWEFLVTWYCLSGESFIVALNDLGSVIPINSKFGKPSSQPRSLLVLPPHQFRHIVKGQHLAGWQFLDAAQSGPMETQTFLPEEVIHDFLPNPYCFWRGLSPLSVAMMAAQTDLASAHFMKRLLANHGETGLIVRTDEQVDAAQREELFTALRRRQHSDSPPPLFLWGATEVVRPTLSSADLQFLENRKMSRQEICAAFFRIPQSLVGFTENANRSIAETERLNFVENSILPLCARLEAAVEPIVKSFGADLLGWFDTDSIPAMQQARRNRVDTASKLFALGYPVNAINQALELGLPHLPWGDKGHLPTALNEAGELSHASAPSIIHTPSKIQSADPCERTPTGLEQLKNLVEEALDEAGESSSVSPPSKTQSADPCEQMPPGLKQLKKVLKEFPEDEKEAS